MPRSDHYRLPKTRVVVLRGYDPNEPSTLTATVVPKAGEAILSGMIVSKVWDGTSQYEWVKGAAAGLTPYVALQSDIDEDVLECGKLTGLSCAGDFEIQTPHYKTGDTYNDGSLVYSDGTTGNIKSGATTGDQVLGFVSSGLRGPKRLDIVDSAAVGGNVILQEEDSSAVVPINVVIFTTNYSGVAVAP